MLTDGTKSLAFRYLDRRDYSVRELTDKLTEKGVSPEEAEECCQWLCSLHLLDDERYAALAVRHYAAKGYGVNRVRQELQRRGVPRELWDAALEEMPEDTDTLESLAAARLRGADDRKAVTRAANALIRRGFPPSEVWDVIRRLRRDADGSGAD